MNGLFPLSLLLFSFGKHETAETAQKTKKTKKNRQTNKTKENGKKKLKKRKKKIDYQPVCDKTIASIVYQNRISPNMR